MFQRLMHNLFDKVPGILIFQDDILVMGRTREKHDRRVKNVLEILDGKGLTAEHTKCKFASNSVKYLGHEITGDGISPKRELLQAIKDSPLPRNKDELRSFLEMLEFYAKFIKNFSHKTYVLRQLLKQRNKYEWSEECDKTFLALKNEMCTALPLQGFDPALKNFVTTDPSSKGLGAVLTQDSNGVEFTLAFASRTLTPAEETLSVIEREALACVWSLEHFRQFIWGSRVTLYTDHKPLTKVFTTKGLYNASPRLARLSVRLFDYMYDIQYVPGVRNVIANFLSRMPVSTMDKVISPETEKTSKANVLEQYYDISSEEWLT